MARVTIEFSDDHGGSVEISERSTVPLTGSGVAAAQLAQAAFQKFLLVCGLSLEQPAPPEPAASEEPASGPTAEPGQDTTAKENGRG